MSLIRFLILDEPLRGHPVVAIDVNLAGIVIMLAVYPGPIPAGISAVVADHLATLWVFKLTFAGRMVNAAFAAQDFTYATRPH